LNEENTMKNLSILAVALAVAVAAVACSGSSDSTETGDGQGTHDAGHVVDSGQPPADAGGDPADAGSNPSDAGDTSDAGVQNGLVASDLVGTFTANNPSTACYATLLDNAIVKVTATDSDTVSITDGTLTFNCDLSGTTLVCPSVSGASAVTLQPGVDCSWPYQVTVTITEVTKDSFAAAVAFVTSASPTSETCANYLGVCSGSASGTFSRYVGNDTPPPAAMVKKSAK
jgi:hypothetical protein